MTFYTYYVIGAVKDSIDGVRTIESGLEVRRAGARIDKSLVRQESRDLIEV